MDPWMLYESQATDRHNQARERQLLAALNQPHNVQTWRRRTAFQSGLLLLRCARRLIQYGKPPVEASASSMPTLRRIR